MEEANIHSLVKVIPEDAYVLSGALEDYDPLLTLIGDARFVLLGEATHGTHEFYREHCKITKRLIREKGFRAVAIEGDWPDAHHIHRFIQGEPNIPESIDALEGFRRFPSWMWRNADILNFLGWLRAYNEQVSKERPSVGFYGLDLFNLNGSIDAVLTYLDRVDPTAAAKARQRYNCFESFGTEMEAYGYATELGLSDTCEKEVISQLLELRRKAQSYAHLDGRLAADQFFFAEQNARLVQNAEEYYLSILRGTNLSWNLRDRHMAETLEALEHHLAQWKGAPKIVVWAHNSHLGDARATQMRERGQWNLGQLLRERVSQDAVLVGFTTHHGTVTAAAEWGGLAERMHVPPALEGSYESAFHGSGIPEFLLVLRDTGELAERLREPRLERAIGVIYRPENERYSHYLLAWLGAQFDAMLHFDETRAVEPLERRSEWRRGELAETYPSGV